MLRSIQIIKYLSTQKSNQFAVGSNISITVPDVQDVTQDNVLNTMLTDPTLILGSRAPETQTHSNPYHQDTISVGSTLPYNHSPTLHSTTARMISQLQNRTKYT